MENFEDRVSTVKAIGIIALVLFLTTALFIAPVSLGTKLYLYLFCLVVPSYFIFKKQYVKETSNSVFMKGNIWENLSVAGKVSLVYIAVFVIFCGTVQFFMYYFGNELYFFEITLYYICFGTPLVIHWVIKLAKEKEKAVQYISDIFSLWLIGYCLVWLSMLFWLIILESD